MNDQHSTIRNLEAHCDSNAGDSEAGDPVDKPDTMDFVSLCWANNPASREHKKWPRRSLPGRLGNGLAAYSDSIYGSRDVSEGFELSLYRILSQWAFGMDNSTWEDRDELRSTIQSALG